MINLIHISTGPESGEYKTVEQSFRRYYFGNSILCGNCNGDGLQGYMDYCRACNGKGIQPISEYLRKAEDKIFAGVKYKLALIEVMGKRSHTTMEKILNLLKPSPR